MEQELKTINIKAPETLEASLESITGPLEVSLSSTVSGGKVTMPLPTIVQTQGLPEKDAMLFIGECAEGKRKIAKAVRSKYETITNEESGITEYSTFDELSNKISQIPVEVPLGSAMEQNGGVLTFYDVYNEALKAMKEFAGYGFNGVCAFELDKWSYDDDHKVTLSGADAYYTSDGTFIKDNIIYKNGNQIGELDNSIYQFQDINAENTNRFVVYFFNNERYQVPKTLHATSCLNLWCIKGTPLMNFYADFTQLNSINVYDGELEAKDANDFLVNGLTMCQTMILAHLKSYQHKIIGGNNIIRIVLPNLTEVGGYTQPIVAVNNIKEIHFPQLKRTSSQLLNQATNCRIVSAPELEEVTYTQGLTYQVLAEEFYFPKLKKILSPLVGTTQTINVINLDSLEETSAILLGNLTTNEISLPKFHISGSGFVGSTTKIPTISLGDGMRDGVAGNIRVVSGTNTYLTTLTVANGFKAKLNLTGCNGLSREVLVDIINNLADLTGEASLNLIMGATLLDKLTDADKAIATQKNWTLS